MKLLYYPGCTLKTTASNFEASALAVANALSIEMVEMPRWCCCGTVYPLVKDDLIHHVASVRNLLYAWRMVKGGMLGDGHSVATLCPMCFNTLKRANLYMRGRDLERLKIINTFIGEEGEYRGDVEVLHFLEVLREVGFRRIKERVQRPLKNLKVAPYYGCLLLRPREVGIDDPEEPTVLEELLEALGAEVVDNPYKARCCGSYQTVNKKYLVVKLAYETLSYVKGRGAEAIALTCPLCFFNLDGRQKEVMELHQDFNKIPVFYFTQLMAIAFKLNEKFYGFDLNYVNPTQLLKNKNIL